MVMDPSMMASGAGQPQAPAPAVEGAAPAAGGDPQAIMQVLESALQQVVDKEGYVDVARLASIWPQLAQQAGLNIPFETVLQLISQSPEIIAEIINKMGLSGIIVNGQKMAAEDIQNFSEQPPAAKMA